MNVEIAARLAATRADQRRGDWHQACPSDRPDRSGSHAAAACRTCAICCRQRGVQRRMEFCRRIGRRMDIAIGDRHRADARSARLAAAGTMRRSWHGLHQAWIRGPRIVHHDLLRATAGKQAAVGRRRRTASADSRSRTTATRRSPYDPRTVRTAPAPAARRSAASVSRTCVAHDLVPASDRPTAPRPQAAPELGHAPEAGRKPGEPRFDQHHAQCRRTW